MAFTASSFDATVPALNRGSSRTSKRVMSRMALAVLASLMVVGTAQARPDLRKMTCAQAQNMVKKNGQVVFTTSNTTYSMFVSNRRYCDPQQVLRTQYGPTKDNPKCPVAYECYERLFRSHLWD